MKIKKINKIKKIKMIQKIKKNNIIIFLTKKIKKRKTKK